MKTIHFRISCKLGLIGLLALAIAAPVVAAGETTLQRVARTGSVVIGYRESSIPFSYVDNGKPVGYAIDLCRRVVGAVGQKLHRDLQIVYRPVSSANRIEMVRSGQVDLECGSTTNNAERRKQAAFTIPHFIVATRFMVRSDSGIEGREQLRHATVVTTKGTTAEKMFPELNLQSKLVSAPDHAASFAMLQSGQADAFLLDDILLAGFRASAPDPSKFRILDDVYRLEALAIMLSPDDADFKAIVDGEMKRLIQSGEINAIYRQWFEQPIPPKGTNLRWPIGHLLRNSFRYPSDWAPDF
jgi:glutamate/aspartate transport system substrate-binding protein